MKQYMYPITNTLLFKETQSPTQLTSSYNSKICYELRTVGLCDIRLLHSKGCRSSRLQYQERTSSQRRLNEKQHSFPGCVAYIDMTDANSLVGGCARTLGPTTLVVLPNNGWRVPVVDVVRMRWLEEQGWRQGKNAFSSIYFEQALFISFIPSLFAFVIFIIFLYLCCIGFTDSILFISNTRFSMTKIDIQLNQILKADGISYRHKQILYRNITNEQQRMCLR